MGYDMMTRETGGYFRLNIWGMSGMRYLLDAAGVLGDEIDPKFPTLPEKFKDCDRDDLMESEEGREFLALNDAALARERDDLTVPIHKFASNEGWIVTKRECLIISHGLRELDKDKICQALVIKQKHDEIRDVEMSLHMKKIDRAEAEQKVAEIEQKTFTAPDEEVDDWQKTCEEFANYCEKAAEEGGFNVY